MRLIDADSIKYHRTKECGGHGVFLDVDMVYKEEVDAIPTIDPESLRPHGRWNVSDGIIENVVCSRCGTHFQSYYQDYRYCPRCGAKMDGGEQP